MLDTLSNSPVTTAKEMTVRLRVIIGLGWKVGLSKA